MVSGLAACVGAAHGSARIAAAVTGHLRLLAPACSAATGRAPKLRHVKTVLTKVPFRPFGVTALPGGRWDLVGTTGPSVAVLANRAGGVPKLVRAGAAAAGGDTPALETERKYSF